MNATASDRKGARGVFAKLSRTMLLCVAVLGGTNRASGADPKQPQAESRVPLQFRRIFVAEEDLSELQLDGVYIPVKRERFEELVRSLAVPGTPAGNVLQNRIVQATYTAQLAGEERLEGEAELDIAHEGDRQSILVLDPCNLVIKKVTWEPAGAPGQPADAIEPSPRPKIGVDDQGRFAFLVPASGKLRLTWTLRSQSDSPEQPMFAIRLPACPLTRLLLDLPDEVRPIVNHGFASLDAQRLNDEPWNRWSLDVGGQTTTLLRIVPFQEGQVSSREVLVRQHATHRLTPRDAESTFTLRLDVLNEPLGQLPLTLDPPMRLVDVTCEGRPLRWTEGAAQSRRQVLVEFSEPLLGLNRTVVVRTLAPVDWGRPWHVPELDVSEGVWLQGSANLELSRSLVLDKLTTRGCRQLDNPSATANNPEADADTAAEAAAPSESIRIEFFDPQARIETVLRVRPSELDARTGTSVNLGRGRTSIVQTTDFTTNGPPRYELNLETPLRWTIDLIETRPPTALEDWSLVGRTARSRLIEIRLREPLAPGQPVRLKVYAHGDGLRSGVKLAGESLRLGAYPDATSSSTLVALSADPPNQIRLDGDSELERVAIDGLANEEQGLVTTSPGTVLYRDGPGADDVMIDLSSDPPNYSAWIDIESEFSERKLELSYRIRVQPKSSTVDRLQVHFTEPSADGLDWSLPGEVDLPLTARRLTPESAGQVDGGETWQITLPGQRDAPFELQARRTIEFTGQASLPLVSLPGASTQIGTLIIRSAESMPLEIVPQNLRTMSADPLSPGRYSMTRAVYRYDPSQDSRATVKFSPDSGQRSSAWVWSCDLATRHYQDGKTVHMAEYRIEGGASQLTLRMPDAVEWLSATVDGRDVPIGREAIGSTELSLPLPRGVRFPVVQVRYVTHTDPLTWLGSIVAVWPRCDQPVFRRNWVAWLPPGFACVSPAATPEEDSWRQRLFGVLLRPSAQAPFAPFSRDSWTPRMSRSPDGTQSLENQDAEQLLRDLASQYQILRQATGEEASVSWSDLLGQWQSNVDDDRRHQPQVWIDQLSLGDLGIFPQSAVHLPEASDDQPPAEGMDGNLGAEILAAHHLAMLVDANRVLLTAMEGLAEQDAATSLPGLRNVRRLPEGGSNLWLRQQPHELRWIRLESWIDRPPLPQVCWQPGDTRLAHRIDEIFDQSGWTAHRIRTTSSVDDPIATRDWTEIQVYQPQVFQMMGWASLLAATGLTIWLVRRRLTLVWPLIGAAGIAALLSPWLLVPVVQCVFLGAVLGSLLAMMHAARSPRFAVLAEHEELPTTSIVAQALAMLLVLALLLCDSALAQGAEPASEPDQIFQVVCPIDGENQPSGDYVYVPRDFYYALLEKSSGRGGSPQPWMIYDASYHAIMHWNAAEEQLSVVELSATYELEVFQATAVIRLPMLENQAHLLPNRALLDGRPATVSWSEEKGGLALDIDAPGSHRLELAFRPQILRDGTRDRFELAIPRVANSTLRAELPAEVKDFDFPTALGTTEMDHQAGNWIVYLGPTDRLAASWPADVEKGVMPETLEAEQLLWLRVQKDSIQVDARLRFSNLSAPIAQVNLFADPRLRLLPPPDDSPIAWYESTEGPTQTIHLRFEPPDQQELEVNLSFRLDQTASVGRIRLPRLTSSADRTSRRWLAVTVDPALVCEATPEVDTQGPTPAEFAAAWGPTESLPELVLDTDQPTGPTSLPVRPRGPRATARQRLELACGQESADLVLSADVHLLEGFRLQYEIALPEAVHVDHVTLEETGQERLSHWSRDNQGNLILRLQQAVSQDHRIQIHGRLDVAPALRPGAVLALPEWSIAGVDQDSQQVDIYRRDQVQIRKVNSVGFIPADGFREGLFRPGWGRWVASLSAAAVDASETHIEVVPIRNQPRTSGQMVIAVRRETDSWWAEADFHLTVSGGVLDVLRLEIPADWKGPHEVSTGTTISLPELPGKGRRYLLVRPEQAVQGEFQLRLRAPISATPRERIRVPDIVPLNVDRLDGFVLMPSKVDQQRIIWERSGLQAKPLPDQFRSRTGTADISYGTIRPRFQATIKDIQLESGVAYIRLADHCIDLADDGRVLGVSTFDLEPAGRSECRLFMPEGLRVLHLTVAELPVFPLPGEGRQLRVPLGPQQLAQRIQVLFVGRIVRDAGNAVPLSLRAPILQGLPVENTCWTLRRPAGGDWDPIPSSSAVSSIELDWLRVRNIARLIAKAEDVLKDGDPDEIVRWYVPWARRWVAARSRLLQGAVASEPSNEAARQELANIDENQQRIAQRLGVDAHLLAAEQEAKQTSESADVWRIAGNPRRVTTSLVTSGKSELPLVRQVERPRRISDQRMAAAGLLGGLVLIALFFLPHPSLDDPLRRYPEIFGVLLGAIWWWAFAASAVGCLVFFLSLLGLLSNAARRGVRRLNLSSF